MASSGESNSQLKRPPAPMARQSSSTATSTPMSRSLSDGPPRTAMHKVQRQHLVGHGHGRVQRNTSQKNLSKLGKQARQQDDGRERHHRRNHSGPPVSAPSSPRPGFKRNASTGGVILRAAGHGPHGHVHSQIRKNHSSGHLPRQANKALKTVRKHARSRDSSRNPSPEPHPSVRFDVADDVADEEGGNDDGWTEESASQSPNTTRSNTRSNSMILDAHKPPAAAAEGPSTVVDAAQAEAPIQQRPTQVLPDRTRPPERTNGGDSHHRSKLPDADMITSRLLQRSSSRKSLPQASTVSATVHADPHSGVRGRVPPTLSQSSGSTLVDTPGRDLVSRFMDGGSSAGTPKSTYMPSRGSPQSTGGDLDAAKRNKSMPNFGEATAPSKAQHHRSGTTTPTDLAGVVLPPSRAQQKLMLQRMSTETEPQKAIPSTIPRTGQPPTFVAPNVPFTASAGGRLDPRLQQQFNHVAIEYKVVRRYRNPLADAILRIQHIPGVAQKSRLTKTVRPSRPASVHGSSSAGTSFNGSTAETEMPASRRSQASFENMDGSDDGPRSRRQSLESQHDRLREEAEDICRRLWEATEHVAGD